jgi:hypothetical protein
MKLHLVSDNNINVVFRFLVLLIIFWQNRKIAMRIEPSTYR